jgi:hypothetical protein
MPMLFVMGCFLQIGRKTINGRLQSAIFVPQDADLSPIVGFKKRSVGA